MEHMQRGLLFNMSVNHSVNNSLPQLLALANFKDNCELGDYATTSNENTTLVMMKK